MLFNYRCRKSVDCVGFVIDYTSTSCYRVPNMGSSTDNIVDTPNVNFFRKACLRGPYLHLDFIKLYCTSILTSTKRLS
jgi:hypothetical protein